MKVFAVVSLVKFIRQPKWLAYFDKNFVKHDWHVTLKQTCIIKAKDISDIKKKLEELNKKLKIKNDRIKLNFNKLFIDKEKRFSGKTIMIRSGNKEIVRLQKKVVAALKGYNNYNEEESRVWEKNFHPHITIASSLNEKGYEKAKEHIGKNIVCEGVVNSITLIYKESEEKKMTKNYLFK